ncbi:Xaa-Pro aminopeptidase [Dokdonella fugitiva]|jgi:Xaa-Pro aminopeptidase|uniref:Xaa-Pro aminopeptidase n=1 Tax=Dokdonella fugitiva TaxID=328517 RepID=A0A4R2IF71_9GAMM|nr:Xaa-Pro aminopeptidase [Dokdonella fugitiva]MBA8882197.1 Xaa-Pro aminopeptidase [Dokdonella fugitiva]TCO42997.1 Xaa-Pro aminopeptidase [Dokdonella fugitiva]
MIEPREYARRRKQLMRMAGPDAIVIVAAAPERVRNNDAHYPYRQDSDFHYLTGFPEPDAVLALVPGREPSETILFCRERDAERERWDGPRAGTEGAVATWGLDDAFPIDDIDDILPGLIEGRTRVYYHFGRDSEFDLRIIGWVNRVRAQVRLGAKPPHEFVALSHLLHDLRLYKSRAELRLMRRSAQIAAEAHVRAMRATRPGLNEHEVEAELLHAFRKHGAVPSYEPIVGGGANACVLHYRANNAELRDGDLLLVDAGAEFECYASDITRTWPVNGRFSPEQRALYDIVLAAQLDAIGEVRAGRSFDAYHEAAVRTITRGLCRLGLLAGSVEKNLREHAYRRFYMHKTGHWLGLDVHDVGDYRIDGEFRELEPGMVVTVEPGLYVAPDAKGVPARFRGIGIRIEDDVVVTNGDPEVISAGVPKHADEIEALMAGGR